VDPLITDGHYQQQEVGDMTDYYNSAEPTAEHVKILPENLGQLQKTPKKGK
jgi:hypothetical protein